MILNIPKLTVSANTKRWCTMPEFHVISCTGEQCGTLIRNAWKYLQINGKHIRIRPRTPDVSIIPPASVNYTAEIEVLDTADKTLGEADTEAREVVEDLFAKIL
jgi:hypothetical protein